MSRQLRIGDTIRAKTEPWTTPDGNNHGWSPARAGMIGRVTQIEATPEGKVISVSIAWGEAWGEVNSFHGYDPAGLDLILTGLDVLFEVMDAHHEVA